MIDNGKLHESLTSAGLEITGVAICKLDATQSNWKRATWYNRKAEDRLVRIDWMQFPPTAEQDKQAADLVAAHDGTPTLADKLTVDQAFRLKSSDLWATLDANQQAAIKAILDKADAEAAAIVRAG